MRCELSILIPARNEMFLARTIDDILANMRGDTEIIAVLDGQWADPGIEQDERVNVVYLPEAEGQRAATNLAAKLSRGRWLMKVDAHCAFAEGFDRVMVDAFQELEGDSHQHVTMVPVMKNLHAFDWVCGCGWRQYQGPTPEACPQCGGTPKREMIWQPKKNTPNSTAYRFDQNLKFDYWGAYKKRQRGDLVETMSLQGSCWMLSREKYFELDICDEAHGGWGQQGTEVACKTWLSGGRVLVNKRTWYAHMFRTQGGDFGFPYPLSGRAVKMARNYSRRLFLDGEWQGAKYPLSWLVERFRPVPEWHEEGDGSNIETIGPIRQGVVYYTCNTHAGGIDAGCRKKLGEAVGKIPVVSVSLNAWLDFGDQRVVVQGERGPLMMHRQILAGLRESQADFVFLCESDVLYHPSHFEFEPERRDVFYYNTNVWKLHLDGLATWTDDLQQVSGLCAARELLIDFYERRVAQIEADGFDRHYEPRGKRFWGHQAGGKYGEQSWQSRLPNVCIRHGGTLTKSKRGPEEFRNPKYAAGWRTSEKIPGWGRTSEILEVLR